MRALHLMAAGSASIVPSSTVLGKTGSSSTCPLTRKRRFTNERVASPPVVKPTLTWPDMIQVLGAEVVKLVLVIVVHSPLALGRPVSALSAPLAQYTSVAWSPSTRSAFRFFTRCAELT